MVKKLLLGVIVAATLAGFGQALSAQTRVTTQCSLAGKGRFDTGWVETVGKQDYRCVTTLGRDLKPIGAAWVRLDDEGRVESF